MYYIEARPQCTESARAFPSDSVRSACWPKSSAPSTQGFRMIPIALPSWVGRACWHFPGSRHLLERSWVESWAWVLLVSKPAASVSSPLHLPWCSKNRDPWLPCHRVRCCERPGDIGEKDIPWILRLLVCIHQRPILVSAIYFLPWGEPRWGWGKGPISLEKVWAWQLKGPRAASITPPFSLSTPVVCFWLTAASGG